jgi:hypothetical protein
MSSDPVVAEIRRIREELAARFNYDTAAILEDARQRHTARGQKVIHLPPRRPADVAAKLRETKGMASNQS